MKKISNNIFFTKKAIKKIKNILLKKKYKNYKFRIYIIGGGCNGFQYKTILDKNINKFDNIFSIKKIKIIIDNTSIQYLSGSKIDYLKSIEESKFIIKNPNAKNTCSCGLSFNL